MNRLAIIFCVGIFTTMVGGAVFAQGLGGLGTANGGGNAADGGGAGNTGGGIGATGIGDRLGPDEAFSNIQRGDSVGSTGNTGAGFGGVTPQNGAAGGGGFGGAGGLGGGLGGFGGLGGLGGFGGGLGNNGLGNNNGSSQPLIRTRLRNAISSPQNPTTQTSAIQTNQRLNTRLSDPRLQRQFGDVRASFDDGTVTLRGTAVSERDRRMSQLLMQLEPGVRRVDNQVRVSN